MRSIKELLILLRDYIKEDKYFIGMCHTYQFELDLTADEKDLLRMYLRREYPINFNTVLNVVFSSNVFATYWWKAGDKKPRINWLNKQINKL